MRQWKRTRRRRRRRSRRSRIGVGCLAIVPYSKSFSCDELAFKASNMTTDEKIKFYADNCDPEDTAQLKAVFTDAEMKRLWDRFKTARNKRPDVEEEYQKVCVWLDTQEDEGNNEEGQEG